MEDLLPQCIAELGTATLAGIGAVTVVSIVWLFGLVSGRKPLKLRIDVEKQSVKTDPDGDETVRACPLMLDRPVEYMEEGTQTLHDCFLRGLRESNNGPCLGWRSGPGQPFEWITYQNVLDRSQKFGSGLMLEGANPNPLQFIGIFAQNRVEWKIAEQACNSFSMVVVPLYDTLGPQSIKHIINQCELKIVVVDKKVKAKGLLNGVENGKFSLDLIIIMQQPDEELQEIADKAGVKLKKFTDVESDGAENLKEFVPPKPEDLHTICYTSGTTGLPKGAMLTHRNFVANAAGVFCLGHDTFLKMDSSDVHLSYLPLAHVFERVLQVQLFYTGARVGYFQGDVKLLLDDVGALKPTVFAMVPRLINRMYDKVWAGASQSMIKKFLLNKATSAKLKLLDRSIITRDTFWDKLVFKKVQNMMGGRVRICITGAAPISSDVLNFMRVALGVNFSEGYGQTEATAAISFSLPGDFKSGSVGTPVASNIVKLVDVPEKNYFAAEGKGEVCVKGTNIFVGYYKDKEKTKEALDEDGWLHTGDVGTWLENGALKIIDRKKHIFKLAQGEYIAPEKIEGVLVQSPAVAQIFLHGDSLKASLVAVVVPDQECFVAWCAGKGVNGDYERLCENDAVNGLVLEDMCAIGRKRGLKSFELPKKIFLTGELFSVENDMLTPTFKSRRPQILKRYNEEITRMYAGLD